MKTHTLNLNRLLVFELIRQAIGKKWWIKNMEGPEWFTPDELYAKVKRDVNFGINPDKDIFVVADPREALEEADEIIARYKAEREAFALKIKAYDQSPCR